MRGVACERGKPQCHDEVHNAPTLQAISRGHPSFLNIVVHYARSKQAAYVRETLQTVIREVVESDELDLEADPSVVGRLWHPCYIV